MRPGQRVASRGPPSASSRGGNPVGRASPHTGDASRAPCRRTRLSLRRVPHRPHDNPRTLAAAAPPPSQRARQWTAAAAEARTPPLEASAPFPKAPIQGIRATAAGRRGTGWRAVVAAGSRCRPGASRPPPAGSHAPPEALPLRGTVGRLWRRGKRWTPAAPSPLAGRNERTQTLPVPESGSRPAPRHQRFETSQGESSCRLRRPSQG
mmetsp:Transcript_14762/g.35155  ORF Transcript_14762/g.35155 Transcript_14762/m.35155 type:complete len:208 (+) Transcript_14762:552-1175(+)